MVAERAPDYEAKRADIRAAAVRLLAADGYGRTTLARISRRVGLSLAQVHYHYTGREPLLADIVNRHMDLLLTRLEAEAPEALPGAERLHALAAAYAAAIGDASLEHRAVLGHLAHLAPEEQAAVRGRMRWVLALFAQALEDAVPDPAPEWAKVQALSLLAMLNATAVWFRDGRAIGRTEFARTATEMVLGAARA